MTQLKGMIELEAKVRAGIKRDDEAGVWVTYAPSLQVFSQGTTEAQARAALADAVGLLLTTAYDLGMLDRVLKGAGLSPIPSTTLLFRSY